MDMSTLGDAHTSTGQILDFCLICFYFLPIPLLSVDCISWLAVKMECHSDMECTLAALQNTGGSICSQFRAFTEKNLHLILVIFIL